MFRLPPPIELTFTIFYSFKKVDYKLTTVAKLHLPYIDMSNPKRLAEALVHRPEVGSHALRAICEHRNCPVDELKYIQIKDLKAGSVLVPDIEIPAYSAIN